jgi:hypothetical protein
VPAVLFVQTFGDLVNFNPHVHVLAADGAFDADGGFSVLPPIPRKLLEPWFREGLVSDVTKNRFSSGIRGCSSMAESQPPKPHG